MPMEGKLGVRVPRVQYSLPLPQYVALDNLSHLSASQSPHLAGMKMDLGSLQGPFQK